MPRSIIFNGVPFQVNDNGTWAVANADGTAIGGGGGGNVAVATANPPTYTEGAVVPLSTDLGGTLRTTAGAGGGGGITQVGNAATGAATNVGYGAGQLRMPVDGSAVTQPVSVASLPLPAGAATEASLGTDGATPPTIPGTGIRGWLRSIYDTLKGTLATDPIDRAARLLGHVTVDNASLAVTGRFWQTTQPVSGTVTANAGTGVFDVTPATPVATDYLPVRLTDGTAFYTAGGGAGGGGVAQTQVRNATNVWTDVGYAAGDQNMPVAVQGTVPVSGTFWQATQPVSLAAAVDVSDRAARLAGHVTVDNASIPVT